MSLLSLAAEAEKCAAPLSRGSGARQTYPPTGGHGSVNACRGYAYFLTLKMAIFPLLASMVISELQFGQGI